MVRTRKKPRREDVLLKQLNLWRRRFRRNGFRWVSSEWVFSGLRVLVRLRLLVRLRQQQQQEGRPPLGRPCVSPPLLATMVSIGIGIGLFATLGGSWRLYLEFQAKLAIKLKKKFFRRNGGPALEKHHQGSTAEEAKIFTYEELKKATNNFEKRRIVGKGVCEGFLLNDRINVAIKKSKKTVDPDQADQFINEIIQLSKIEHENVVKLLGCCLETEVPLLVYEFVPEGTLFDYIHNESNTFTKQWKWETRLRIAAEIVGGLSHLHSLAIIHKDVKPSNILLGDNFTVKVSDFGISHDEKDVATGYLDPEYLQTNQLTEKSDIYSFGVVLVELLIDVAPSTRSKNRINVVKDFLSLLKENQLSELLDCYIVEEGNKEQIKEVIKLAERCLRLKGNERPTMEELKNELEGMTNMHPSVNAQSNLEKQEHDLNGDQKRHADEDGGCSICNISLGCLPQMNEYM